MKSEYENTEKWDKWQSEEEIINAIKVALWAEQNQKTLLAEHVKYMIVVRMKIPFRQFVDETYQFFIKEENACDAELVGLTDPRLISLED